MKPTVRYVGPAERFGERARLVPINHRNHVPGQGVTNWHPVITSRVLSWDEAGRIETLHTVYMPLIESDDEDEMVALVGKPEGVAA